MARVHLAPDSFKLAVLMDEALAFDSDDFDEDARGLKRGAVPDVEELTSEADDGDEHDAALDDRQEGLDYAHVRDGARVVSGF